MPFKIGNKNNNYWITIDGEGPTVHALQMRPEARELYLNSGIWLVLVFAVWSSPDREAVNVAINAARIADLNINIGIRPFDEFNEINTWCLEATVTTGSPVWMILSDGKFLAQKVGMLSFSDLANWIHNEITKA